MKKHPKTLSLEDLSAHQQRIRSIVRKINSYSPTFHINRNYNQSVIMSKIKKEREEYQDRIFQQNMNIIQKLENVQPKVDLKQFPPVNLALRSKRKCNSLSQRKFKPFKDKKSYSKKSDEQIYEQNISMIEKLQTMQKKIKCWQDKSILRFRMIKEKKQKQKRNQILQKFKEISKELSSLKTKNENSRFKMNSPYVNEAKIRKQSSGYFQTNTNSFLTKKSPK